MCLALRTKDGRLVSPHRDISSKWVVGLTLVQVKVKEPWILPKSYHFRSVQLGAGWGIFVLITSMNCKNILAQQLKRLDFGYCYHDVVL